MTRIEARQCVHDWIKDYPKEIKDEVTPAMRKHLVETMLAHFPPDPPPEADSAHEAPEA